MNAAFAHNSIKSLQSTHLVCGFNFCGITNVGIFKVVFGSEYIISLNLQNLAAST